MRRRLVLVRHAKSAWDDPSLADHDRSLATRGRTALPRMREFAIGLELPRLIVLCSTATRAVATLDGISAVLPEGASVNVERSIYDGDAGTLLGRLRSLSDSFESAMIVGHNPTLHDLALALVGSGAAASRTQLATKLPTGAIATMSFVGPWDDLGPKRCALDDLFTPRAPRP